MPLFAFTIMARQSSLKLAIEYRANAIAFPAISCGVYGYPVEAAAQIALSTVVDYLQTDGEAIAGGEFCLLW
jgi:O-acetyl-ADP-ribose deacetylase (regulator of RNase III)